MSEMVERVARTLCEKDIRKKQWNDPVGKLDAMLAGAVDYCWADHVEDARAVLAAMREPTDGQLQAAFNELVPAFDAIVCWRAMIDAALAPRAA